MFNIELVYFQLYRFQLSIEYAKSFSNHVSPQCFLEERKKITKGYDNKGLK